MNEAQEMYSLLPLEECEIHPLARVRFDYGDVDELAESLKTMGQVQPGRAVKVSAGASSDGAKYLVYVGCRRFSACKKAGLGSFKAIVVGGIDKGRLQREVLTENVKRTSLSVLEELNLLANYSRSRYSLEDLSKDIGLSAKLVKARVALAILIQDKGLIESLYKIERISGFRFTYRHVEKMTGFEEPKWLPLAIQAAEYHWKAEEIETMGNQLSLNSLLSALPAWGWQFLPNLSKASEDSTCAPLRAAPETREKSAASDNHKKEREADKRPVPRSESSPSRYQTVARFAQFLICPECGSENVIELPWYPDAIMFRPGRPEKEGGAVPLGKEAISLRSALLRGTCTNEKCGEELEIMLDQRGDGTVLTSRREFLSMVEKKQEPRDSGRGALIWDDVEGVWLKCISSGEGQAYFGYDEGSRKWIIPVSVGVPAAKVRVE